MAPDVSFLGMGLYEWMIVAGVVCAMIVFRLCYERAGLSAKVFNFTLFIAVAAVAIGYISAVLFQSFYSFLETGTFRWGTGATFYGGLIGGAGGFLLLYFLFGAFLFRDGAHKREFGRMVGLITPCIALAHGVGRIGCLLSGCCYGILTDSVFGVPMRVHGEWQMRLPVQLFEAIFLFALCGVLLFLLLKKQFRYNMSVYLAAYGIWRFFIEYLRGDDRGSVGIPFLSPSQLTAILLVIAGIALFLICYFVPKRRGKHEET